MSYERIHQLLDTHLSSYSGLPPLQKENTQEMAKTGRNFVRSSLILSRPSRATLGTSGRDRLVGLYQIDLFTPLNTGTPQMNALADGLVAHFPRSLILHDGDITINMRMTWRETGARATQFYSTAVMVEWECIL